MSPRERQALTAWNGLDPDFDCLSFRTIANFAHLDIKFVRRSVRSLARQGMVRYAKGLWSQDGEPAGAGYGLTDNGRQWIKDNLT